MDNEEKMNILSETTCLIIDGETDKAISLLNSLLEKNKTDIDIIFRKAIIYYRIDFDLDNALIELDNILKIDAKNIDALLLKGEILAGMHRYNEAIEIFNEIHPKVLPYCYKKLIEYIIEYNFYDSNYYSVFEFDAHWEYVYIESELFKRLSTVFLDQLKNNVIRRRLVWIGFGNDLESEIEEDIFDEYLLEEPIVDQKINISSGIRLSDEEPDTNVNNVENVENCIVCGKKLKENQKNLCRACFRKQYASRIIKKLVSVVQPEFPFKKKDLKSLNLDDIQIQDYIWTLQEFDLLDVDNDKFKLKNKDTLNNFRINSKMDPIDFDSIDKENMLNKKCKICGNTLPISQFYKSSEGYEDICKVCKKHIVTAKYLEDIMDYVGFGNEFDENDLIEHIPNQNQVMGMIWSLQDNDLLRGNENQTFILADKSKCLDYLEKYDNDYEFKEKDTNFKTKSKSKSKVSSGLKKSNILPLREDIGGKKSKSLNNQEKQMAIVLKARKDGKTRDEAANIAEIPLYRINHWYKEGKQGFGEDNIKFYNALKKIEADLTLDEILNERKQMNFVLKLLRQGKSESEVEKLTELNESTITSWYDQGKEDYSANTIYFYKEVQKIKNSEKGKDLRLQIKEFIPKFMKLDEKVSKININESNLKSIREDINSNIELLKSASRLRRIDKLENRLSNAEKSYEVLNKKVDDELIKNGYKNVQVDNQIIPKKESVKSTHLKSSLDENTILLNCLYSITGSNNLKSFFISNLKSKGMSIKDGKRIRSIIINEIYKKEIKTCNDVHLRVDNLIKEKQTQYVDLIDCLYSITGNYNLKNSFSSEIQSKGLSIKDGNEVRKTIVKEIYDGKIRTCQDVHLRVDNLIKEIQTQYVDLMDCLYSITGNADFSLKSSFISNLESKGLSVSDGNEIRKIVKNEICSRSLKTCDDVKLRLDDLIGQKQYEYIDGFLKCLYNITGNADFSLKSSFISNLESKGLSVSDGNEIRKIVTNEICSRSIKTCDNVKLRLDDLIEQKQSERIKYLKCLYDITGDNSLRSSFISNLESKGLSVSDGVAIRNIVTNEIRSGSLKTCDDVKLRLDDLIEQKQSDNTDEMIKYLYSLTGGNGIALSFNTEFSTGNLEKHEIKYIMDLIKNEIESSELISNSQINIRLKELVEQKKAEKIDDLLNVLYHSVGKNNLSQSFLTRLSENELNEINGNYIKKTVEEKINNYSIKNRADINNEINQQLIQEEIDGKKAIDKVNELFKEDHECLSDLSSNEKEELLNIIEKSVKENRIDAKNVDLEFKEKCEEFKKDIENEYKNKLFGGLRFKLRKIF